MFDLSRFVEQCRVVAQTANAVTDMQDLLHRTVADTQSLQTAIPQLTARDKAQYNNVFLGYDKILYEDDTVAVFLVDTIAGIDQPPHNHLVDALIGVYQGAEINRFYARSEQGIRLAGEKTIHPGQVLPIRPQTIHAINAESGQLCRAIHIYFGALSMIERSLFNPDDGAEQIYNSEDYYAFCRTS